MKTELQKLSRRKQDLLEELRRCQEELTAKREESCSLKQTFTVSVLLLLLLLLQE